MYLICRSSADCSDYQRWECSVYADWVDVGDRSPWGNDERPCLIRFLLSMTPDEHAQLAAIAFRNINSGAWQGVETDDGGWQDGEPYDDHERQWRLTARDFLDRYASGDWHLTEGMLVYADGDLARELANLRGWCPRGELR